MAFKNLIFFIHGFIGNKKSWGKFSKLIKKDPELEESFSCYFWEYSTKLLSKNPKIQVVADALAAEIDNQIEEHQYNSIILVCHSLGGLVAKRFLLEQFKNNKLYNIQAVLFYALPNNGTKLADFAANLFLRNRQLKQLVQNSDFVHFINEGWSRNNIEQIVDIKYYFGDRDEVVDIDIDYLKLNSIDYEIIPLANHRDIVKPTSKDDKRFVLLRNKLIDIIKAQNSLSDEKLLSEFSYECTTKNNAIIFSHRTKIMEIDSNKINPYESLIKFLNQFTFPDRLLDTPHNGVKKTILIFIIDFGGTQDKHFDPKVHNNFLTLQSSLRAIFLAPPESSTHILGSGKNNLHEYVAKYSPKNTINATDMSWASHILKTNELLERVIVLCANYKQYITDTIEIENRLKQAGMLRVELINARIHESYIQNTKNHNNKTFNTMFQSAAAKYILLEDIPNLIYLNISEKKEIEKSTNIDTANRSKAFGLYSTINLRIGPMNTNNSVVDCYTIRKDKNEDKIRKLKLSSDAYCNNKEIILYENGIKDSMTIVYLAACHYLNEMYWKQNTINNSPKLPEKLANEGLFEWAYNKMEEDFNFHLFTVPEFLACPIMYPNQLESYFRPQSKEI